MLDRALQRRRVHGLLLVGKLLTLREHVSPLTLVLDSLEQPARPLLRTYLHNAAVANVKVIFVSLGGQAPPSEVNDVPDLVHINGRRKVAAAVQAEIMRALAADGVSAEGRGKLVMFDDWNRLTDPRVHAAFPSPADLLLPLSSVTPNVSILGVYHADVPDTSSLPLQPEPSSWSLSATAKSSPAANPGPANHSEYAPSTLTTLQYLATTILTVQSLSQAIARKQSRDRSVAEPLFGLEEEKDGVLVGLPAHLEPFPSTSVDEGSPADWSSKKTAGYYIVKLQHRRKSGREVQETYIFSPPESASTTRRSQSTRGMASSQVLGAGATPARTKPTKTQPKEIFILDEHPVFAPVPLEQPPEATSQGQDGLTFDLNLTAKQREERKRVVLPYYDAQKLHLGSSARAAPDESARTGSSSQPTVLLPGLPGEGGRILYDMGAEDDFDDEEDEI